MRGARLSWVPIDSKNPSMACSRTTTAPSFIATSRREAVASNRHMDARIPTGPRHHPGIKSRLRPAVGITREGDYPRSRNG
jgi:hypothetical protein